VAFVLPSNIARRHMTKGQWAMASARVRLVSNQSVRQAANVAGVSHARVVQAAMVLQWAPELADAVLNGAEPLDRAYEVAADRKAKAEARRRQDLACLCRPPPHRPMTSPDLVIIDVHVCITSIDLMPTPICARCWRKWG
jgi:hypothetical protein